MTHLPDDLIDPLEIRLLRRVRAYSEPAVVPIDAAAVSRAAVATAGGSGLRGRILAPGRGTNRLAWALVTGALVVVVGGAAVTGGWLRIPGTGSGATDTPTTVRMCAPEDVDARITSWDGAAGHRIAAVELHQVGTTVCAVVQLPRPWLADGGGSQLIMGHAGPSSPTILFAPGSILHTLVQVGNYCGPEPVAPVTVAFLQGEALFVATALTPTDLSGVPPCMGVNGPSDDITMHPWTLGAVPD